MGSGDNDNLLAPVTADRFLELAVEHGRSSTYAGRLDLHQTLALGEIDGDLPVALDDVSVGLASVGVLNNMIELDAIASNRTAVYHIAICRLNGQGKLGVLLQRASSLGSLIISEIGKTLRLIIGCKGYLIVGFNEVYLNSARFQNLVGVNDRAVVLL